MVKEHIGKFLTRKEDSHKGDYGRVLVVAGSQGMTGAAYLTSQAALKAGSGLVTNAIPESLNCIMEVKLTEVMTLPVPETPEKTMALRAKEAIMVFMEKSDVAAIGPGLGRNPETRALVRALIQDIKKPVVLDADGINAMEGAMDKLSARASYGTVITPHPGEMSNLCGRSVDEICKSREETAKSVAKKTGSVVCLKGHRTVVASPKGEVYINNTGNSGMASGGTGDVLTGMIASFIGQGVDFYSAAVSAVYLHGLAGDIAAEELGPFSLTATDIIDCFPLAFHKAGI